MTDTLIAFFITLITGLSTGIGGLFLFFPKNKNIIFLATGLILSGIIMIYMSLFEILPSAFEQFKHTTFLSPLFMTISFFVSGIICIALIDYILSYIQNNQQNKYLNRISFLTMIVLTIHNIPEGFVTFISVLENSLTGLPIALTMALHNIPEGIAIAVPVYVVSNSKSKSVLFALYSGLAEPFGAIVGYWILKPYISADVLGITYAGIAGIMSFIALHDLIPTAQKLTQKNSYFYK